MSGTAGGFLCETSSYAATERGRNEISFEISNVLRLFRCIDKTKEASPQQLVLFYDPGVGTLAQPDPWRKWLQNALAVFGLATGYGLDDNVLGAYEFLMENYEEGDEIFMFGFSRGAYTVRMLAGLIHKVGLPRPQQKNSIGPALTAYKRFSEGIGGGGGFELIGPDLLRLPGYPGGESSLAKKRTPRRSSLVSFPRGFQPFAS